MTAKINEQVANSLQRIGAVEQHFVGYLKERLNEHRILATKMENEVQLRIIQGRAQEVEAIIAEIEKPR